MWSSLVMGGPCCAAPRLRRDRRGHSAANEKRRGATSAFLVLTQLWSVGLLYRRSVTLSSANSYSRKIICCRKISFSLNGLADAPEWFTPVFSRGRGDFVDAPSEK